MSNNKVEGELNENSKNAASSPVLEPMSVEEDIEGIRRMFVDEIQVGRIINERQTPAKRAAFVKQHGAAYGYLLVDDDIPERYRVGIFQPGKKYDAWARYSSDIPSERPDKNSTIGIGIKLFNVPRDNTPEGKANGATLDFIMQNTEVFFAADAAEMYEFKSAAMNGTLEEWLKTHPETARILEEMGSRTVDSVLTEPLWSCIPFKYGDDYCKFKLEYESVAEPESPVDYEAPNYLAKDMYERLSKGAARLNFYVQLRNNEQTQELDNARSLWDENEAIPVKVATLVLPRQNILSRNQGEYGESLAFSVWRTLPEMAPVGSIAEARKVIYRSSAEVRRMVNGQPDGEPKRPREPFMIQGGYRPTFNAQWPSSKYGDITDDLQGNSEFVIRPNYYLRMGILTVSCRDMTQPALLLKRESEIAGIVDGIVIQVDNTIKNQGTLRVLLEKTEVKNIRFGLSVKSLAESSQLKIMAYHRVDIGAGKFDEIIAAKPVTISNGNAVVYIESNKDSVLNLITFQFTENVQSFELDNFVFSYAPSNSSHVVVVNDQDITTQMIADVLITEPQAFIELSDGYWSDNIYLPQPKSYDSSRIYIFCNSSYGSNIHVNGITVQIKSGDKIAYISDGNKWISSNLK